MPANTARPRRGVAMLVLCAPLALPPVAWGQIEQIIVTARKKEESLQDVPISVSAFGEEQLQQQGLFRDNDVADFTVNFNTLPQTGRDFDRPVIRGMAAPASRGEANASYFIDGIYISGSIASATTSAVERVEILRGPQSAQFGRATFSGAVNYVTKRPTNEMTGRLKTRAGTSDDYEVGGWVSGPIIEDRLLFLLSADWSQYGGQWHNNLEDGQAVNQPLADWLLDPPQQGDHRRLGAEETQDYLAKLLWKPWDGAEFNVKYGYTETDDSMWPSVVAPEGPLLENLPPGDPRLNTPGGNGIYATLNCWLPPEGRSPLPPGNPLPDEEPWWRTSGGAFCGELDATGWENRVNLPDIVIGVTLNDGRYAPGVEPGLRKNQNRYLLQYLQDIGDWRLTVRGGANTEDFANAYDLDHTETRAVFGLFNFDFIKDSRDWSSEIRLATPADLPVRAEVGAYYFDRHLTQTQRSIPGPGPVFGGSVGFPPQAERDVTNVAWIGTLGWDITDLWQLDLEGRYASEDVEFLGGNRCQSEETYYNFTPRVSLTFKPTEDLRFYVQAANGDKPGDVNSEYFRGDISREFCEQAQAFTTDVVVKPEEQWTYEVGAKTQWLDRRLQANLAIFWIEWSEQSIFQTVNFGSYDFPGFNNEEVLVTTILRNVGDSRNIGGELETLFAVTDELTLIANYGYTHAKFRRGFDSNLADITGNGDVDGKWIPSAPEHSVVLGAVVDKPIDANWSLLFRTDIAYESRRYTQPSNFSYIGDRTLVNLRAGVASSRWDVSAYVRNLLDDETPVAGLNFVNFGYGAIAPGRDGAYGSDDDVYPNMNSLNPQRGRDYGLEVQYKFGAE
jgi:outer membrane receptor protein involved in Fe transport